MIGPIQGKRFQVVLNHNWDWATPEQKIWYFKPYATLKDAEWAAQDMMCRGESPLVVGVACCLGTRPQAQL